MDCLGTFSDSGTPCRNRFSVKETVSLIVLSQEDKPCIKQVQGCDNLPRLPHIIDRRCHEANLSIMSILTGKLK